MTEIYLKRSLGGFVPVDETGEEIVRGIPLGTVTKHEFTRPRNEKFHRLFFGLLGLVFENVEGYPSVEQLLTHVKMGIGHFDMIYLPDTIGAVAIPRSISFAKMKEDDFRPFFNRAVDFIISAILPGTGKEDLEREVFLRVGIDLENLR